MAVCLPYVSLINESCRAFLFRSWSVAFRLFLLRYFEHIVILELLLLLFVVHLFLIKLYTTHIISTADTTLGLEV